MLLGGHGQPIRHPRGEQVAWLGREAATWSPGKGARGNIGRGTEVIGGGRASAIEAHGQLFQPEATLTLRPRQS